MKDVYRPPFAHFTEKLSRFQHLISLRLPTSLFLESLQPLWCKHPCTALATITNLHLYGFNERNTLFTAISGESIADRLSSVFPNLQRLIVHLPAKQSKHFFTKKVEPYLNRLELLFRDL